MGGGSGEDVEWSLHMEEKDQAPDKSRIFKGAWSSVVAEEQRWPGGGTSPQESGISVVGVSEAWFQDERRKIVGLVLRWALLMKFSWLVRSSTIGSSLSNNNNKEQACAQTYSVPGTVLNTYTY